MADDDGGDWFADAGDDEPAAAEAAPAAAAAAGGGEAPAAAAAAGADDAGAADGGAAAEEKPTAEDEYLDPDKLILFRHWKRPKFLQYKYLYDYRYNYYNDVLDYLDKRGRGVCREIPHAQTWAERALRTYNDKINKVESFRRQVEDTKLVTKTKLSGAFQLHHSKSYITRRYSSVLV